MDFLRIFQLRQPIAWTADLEYWISGREEDASCDPAWRTEEGYLSLCRDLGIFPYYWYDDFWCGKPKYDESVDVRITQEHHARITSWNTPAGEISEIFSYMPESSSWAYVKHPVSNLEDLKVLCCLIEHRSMEPIDLGAYQKRLIRWRAEGGIPALALPRSPLAAFFYEWAGVVNGVYLLMDYPETVQKLFALMTRQEDVLLDAICAARPPLVHFADNVSADNMAGYFDTYMREVYEHRVEKLHRAGVCCAVHLDGVIKGIIGKIASTGVDAIEALTPVPGGDVQAEEIRKLCGRDDVVLWGGVPGLLFSPPYTRDDVRRHVRSVLDAWKDTPFILGAADQVPADGDISLVRDISEYIQEQV